MADFQIGSFEFLRFNSAPPARMRPHIAIETKPGRDGFAALAQGTWGEPFTIQAESVFPSLAAAMTAQNAYQAAPSLTPVNIIWAGVNWTTYSINFVVERVVVDGIRGMPAFHGPVDTIAPAWLLSSTWTVIPRASA